MQNIRGLQRKGLAERKERNNLVLDVERYYLKEIEKY